MFELRPYQTDAVNAATTEIMRTLEPILLELATGAGKSLICAHVAEFLREKSGKPVLCVAPSAELVEQNHEKYTAYGWPASLYSAKLGKKCLRHDVIFATPGSIANSLHKIDNFAGVIIDEAHRTTPEIIKIIDHLRVSNPRLRVVGMTGTPYRTGEGYIYGIDQTGRKLDESEASTPYFGKLVYKIDTPALLDMGFLTPVTTHPSPQEYDTAGLATGKDGKFTAASIDRAFVGRGRLTAEIVADIVDNCHDRKGVMIFTANRHHMAEVAESLPPELTRCIDSTTKTRTQDVEDFKAQKYKYLVNVDLFTTGFDATHVDAIAVMRATESPGLLQQIIGRGLRLHPGKENTLYLDYAGNVLRHKLDTGLFEPRIEAKLKGTARVPMAAECPSCGFENEFSARPNPEGFAVDRFGHFIDLSGQPILVDGKPYPAHYGRKCQRTERVFGQYVDGCAFRWSAKLCDECGHENDIAARRCSGCGCELVDANEKLQRDFTRIKKDPYATTVDEVLSWKVSRGLSQAGRDQIEIHWRTPYRTVKQYYAPDKGGKHAWDALCRALFDYKTISSVSGFISLLPTAAMPKSIRNKRRKGTQFFDITGYNLEPDTPDNIQKRQPK